VTAWNPIVIPEHALLILEERLREQQAEGVRMPEGMGLDAFGPTNPDRDPDGEAPRF
jgi:hypothetical protein